MISSCSTDDHCALPAFVHVLLFHTSCIQSNEDKNPRGIGGLAIITYLNFGSYAGRVDLIFKSPWG